MYNESMATPNPYQLKVINWGIVAICLITGVLAARKGHWYMIPALAIFGAVGLWRACRRSSSSPR
jgi:hypothetical protein